MRASIYCHGYTQRHHLQLGAGCMLPSTDVLHAKPDADADTDVIQDSGEFNKDAAALHG